MQKFTLFLVIIALAAFMYTSDAKKSTSVTGNIFAGLDATSVPDSQVTIKEALETVKVNFRRYMDSEVTFDDCPGLHDDIYDIDNDYSYTDPVIAKKNIDITLILEGVMNEDQHVDQLHLDVYWNGNLFHSEDHKLDDDVEEQEPYELKFTWFVPGFAPSGGYIVDLFIKSAGQELGCERATFNL